MSTSVTTTSRFVWHEQVSSDPAKAQEFYTQLFGWGIEVAHAGGVDYAMISSGGKTHGGFPPAPEGVPPHWLGNVSVESVDDTVARARTAGGSVMAGPMDIPDVGRYAVIVDPQGAAVALFQPADDGFATEGVFVWDELATSDVEAAKRFYGEVFGWTTADMDMGDGFTYTLFKRDGETDVGGAMSLGEIPMSFWLTYIGSDDVDAHAAKAQQLGATLMREPWSIEGVGRLAIVQDPTGAVFGLFKPSA